MSNPLQQLASLGQSVWYDNIRRGLLTSGALARMIRDDGLLGVTSNPAIFEKAIAGSTDYDEALKTLQLEHDRDAKALYEALAIGDIRAAADVLDPVYRATNFRDGYVSLEVSPYLAHDEQGTLTEARRLWNAVDRPNVMIKVPATDAGIAVLPALLADGLNVNVTLLFSQSAYERVAMAYIDGLERRRSKGGVIHSIASVASFFISRIDSAVDQLIADKQRSLEGAARDGLVRLRGQAAIANAKLVYQRSRQIFDGERWNRLANDGAQSQRLLWASTGTKDPSYRDVRYVEELIGPDTVNTVPAATFDLFRDHGQPRETLATGLEGARAVLADLATNGIHLATVGDRLLDEGLQLFSDAFDQLLATLERKRRNALAARINRQQYQLPEALGARVKETLAEWRREGKMRRLFARDATLWLGDDEAKWLGWLDVANDQLAHRCHLDAAMSDASAAGFQYAVVLGMGGSSLCPDVLRRTFGRIKGHPALLVLDSTDPAQIRRIEADIELERTLFIVSSKSGNTLEPNLFADYFYARAQERLGANAGDHFIAITDPGSRVEAMAVERRFRAIYHGLPSIGGRYSALSNFGMVPAAIMGLDAPAFLGRAEEMLHACSPVVPADENPGTILGVILGEAARMGRDKLTLVLSPEIASLGSWIEQLIAESTGKLGRGIIPVDGERLGLPGHYGEDRVFVYLRLESSADTTQDAAIDALRRAGHPVVTLLIAEAHELVEEFFRWQIATAVAGSVLALNAFDQPDVEASKLATRALTIDFEKTGHLPDDVPTLVVDKFKLFGDPQANTRLLRRRSLGDALASHLMQLGVRDYFAILAYIDMNAAHDELLQAIRTRVRDHYRVATCIGYGPRFLHSTGQAYKGGPNEGVFLQITCDDANDLSIPGHRYSFGIVKSAQARGDFSVLAERGRRALRIHIAGDSLAGLREIDRAIDKALS